VGLGHRIEGRSSIPLELWVSDLKQYLYCPRVVYFHYVLPVEKKVTYKMQVGKELHQVIAELEKRRKLRRYGLKEGVRFFDLWLSSERIGLRGRLDMMIQTPQGCYPVDFKFTEGRPHRNHLYQLAGYAVLIEDQFGLPVRAGFVYLIPSKEALVSEIGAERKEEVMAILEDMRKMVLSEEMPEPSSSRSRCRECEFQNYCGDVR